jgi:hypothetical protein
MPISSAFGGNGPQTKLAQIRLAQAQQQQGNPMALAFFNTVSKLPGDAIDRVVMRLEQDPRPFSLELLNEVMMEEAPEMGYHGPEVPASDDLNVYDNYENPSQPGGLGTATEMQNSGQLQTGIYNPETQDPYMQQARGRTVGSQVTGKMGAQEETDLQGADIGIEDHTDSLQILGRSSDGGYRIKDKKTGRTGTWYP